LSTQNGPASSSPVSPSSHIPRPSSAAARVVDLRRHVLLALNY
jgi:hypothetical protein